MPKIYIFVIIVSLFIIAGCNNDNPVTPNPPAEVLLAQVSGDSVSIQSGSSSTTQSITTGSLNFTDRDSARISFYYSGSSTNIAIPILLYYLNGQSDTILYNGVNLNVSPQEQFINVTIRSPKVDKFFVYRISAANSTGLSYFKFRDLKIYKK